MVLPILNIQDYIKVVIVSSDIHFQKHCNDIFQSLLRKKDHDNIVQHDKLSTIMMEKSDKKAYLFIVEVNGPDLEIYLDFIENVRSQGISCLYMLILSQTDGLTIGQIESEPAIDDVLIYNPENVYLLKKHLFRNLKILINFESALTKCAIDIEPSIEKNEQLDQLKAALDNTSEGILITDIDNTILYIN